MKSDTIASAARRWDAARLLAIRLRAERSAFVCEREASSIPKDVDPCIPGEFRVYSAVLRPCWKTFTDTSAEDADTGRMPEHLWCPTCVERQKVYLAMRAAIRERGTALRQIQALLAGERKRLGFNEKYERPVPQPPEPR